MEEILNKVNDLQNYSNSETDLKDIKQQIKDKQSELSEVENRRSITISAIVIPTLDEKIDLLKTEIDELNEEYKEKYEETKSAFEKDKTHIQDLIERQLSVYKRKDTIDQEKADGIVKVAEDRKKAEEEFAKEDSKIQKDIEDMQRKRAIYQQILDEANATKENMLKAYSEGKSTGNIKNVLDEISANEKKISDIDSEILKTNEAFENKKKSRIAEINDYEYRVNNYKTIEDNIDEIEDLEHLLVTLRGLHLEDINKFKDNLVVSSLTNRLKQEKENSGKENIDEKEKSSDKYERKINSEIDNRVAKVENEQDEGASSKQLYAINKGTIENSQPKESLDENNTKIKGITIGKGITIEYTDGTSTQLIQKSARRLSKLNSKGKSDLIAGVIGGFQPLTEEVLNKVDPSVIYAFQTAVDNGVPKKDVVETMNNYIYSLGGSSNAQAEIRGLITYDRNGMDYWKPSTFISKIINHRYYKTMAEYMKEAKDFATIIKDKKPRSIREYLESRKIELLDKGIDKATNMRDKAQDFIGQQVGKGKEKVDDIAQNINDTKAEVKDALDDTAAKGKLAVSAFKQGYQVSQQIYQDGKTKIDNEGVPKIQKGEDRRTEAEKNADETLKEGNEEER